MQTRNVGGATPPRPAHARSRGPRAEKERRRVWGGGPFLPVKTIDPSTPPPPPPPSRAERAANSARWAPATPTAADNHAPCWAGHASKRLARPPRAARHFLIATTTSATQVSDAANHRRTVCPCASNGRSSWAGRAKREGGRLRGGGPRQRLDAASRSDPTGRARGGGGTAEAGAATGASPYTGLASTKSPRGRVDHSPLQSSGVQDSGDVDCKMYVPGHSRGEGCPVCRRQARKVGAL